MASEVHINDSIPLYVNYFHAVSLTETTETKNIFKNNVGSVEITPRPNYEAYDVVDKIIRPLKEKGILRVDGDTEILVPLEGLLVVPELVTTSRFPLVMIGHGNHAAYFNVTDTKPQPPTKGNLAFSILADPVKSYTGYEGFQKELAKNGIASYSINLNIVNNLDNNETTAFEKMAIDFSQRILLFFLHLKLLRVIAGESITVPPGGDNLPIKFLTGTTFGNLTDALAAPTLDPRLRPLRDAIRNTIDFSRLGFMGHSRGADAVSRIPAYFFNGAALPNPTFPRNAEVHNRISALSAQIGSPQQGVVRAILALEPVASLDLATPPATQHGYAIDNNQTMYFVGVGTHDEDVTLDSVRIYEFPACPKAMIAINGATHKRFNSIWASHEKADEFSSEKLKVNLLSKKQHESILNGVFASCFTGTLGDKPLHLLPFTKRTKFVTDVPLSIDFQAAWNFGFPFTANVPTKLDPKVTSPSEENIKGQGYDFEQDLKAFFVEKNNEGTITISIPINRDTSENLFNFHHFSFRFAKGFDVSKNATRVEEKNFTIQFFENNTPVGKTIKGPDIRTLELRALQALDITDNASADPEFEYSILMQTAEITLAEHLSSTELPRITRIDINVIPDVTKSPPNSTAKVVFGTIGGALLGGAVGVGGGALSNAIFDPAEGKRKKILILSGIAGTAVFGVGALLILKADRHAFVFKDFLLTNRQIPVVGTP